MADLGKNATFWRSFPIFERFDDALIEQVNRMAIHRRWPAGAMVFQRGDEGTHLIAVSEGRIKLSLVTPVGKELTLRHLEPGSILGEMAILSGDLRSADATASIATEGYVISKRDFHSLLSARPDAAMAVISYLCNRLRDTTEQLENIALYDLDARVARFFLTTLRQIHGEDLPSESRLQSGLNQTEIASILGASRPKVNRAIISLEEAGAISRNGPVITCHTDRLMRFAEPEEV